MPCIRTNLLSDTISLEVTRRSRSRLSFICHVVCPASNGQASNHAFHVVSGALIVLTISNSTALATAVIIRAQPLDEDAT